MQPHPATATDLDAILVPFTGPSPPTTEAHGDHRAQAEPATSSSARLAAWPAVRLPRLLASPPRKLAALIAAAVAVAAAATDGRGPATTANPLAHAPALTDTPPVAAAPAANRARRPRVRKHRNRRPHRPRPYRRGRPNRVWIRAPRVARAASVAKPPKPNPAVPPQPQPAATPGSHFTTEFTP